MGMNNRVFTACRGLSAAILQTAVLSVLVLTQSGCNKTAPPAVQTAARSDQQVAADIQAKINAESALSGQSVQVEVQSAIATLNGSVTDSASRSLAGNDAGSVDGVKTVVNNLTVQPATTASAVPPHPFPAPSANLDRRNGDRQNRGNSRDRDRASREQDRANQDRTNQLAQNQNGPNQLPSPQGNPYPAPAPNYQPAQAPQVPPPPPRPAAVSVTLPEGTVVPVRISEALDSAQAQANEVFHGSLAEDLMVNGMVAMSRGASVVGRVVDARDAAHFKGSSLLSIELTQVTSHGRQVPVVTDPYTKEGQARGKNTAEKAGGGAALGAIIGAIAGGGKGAAIGAAAGGGIGAGANGVTRGQQVQIPPETVVNFRLQSPVTVVTSRRAGAPRSEDQDTPHPTLEQR